MLRQTERRREEREREKFTSAAMGGDRDREQQRHIETIKRKKHLLHIVFCARVKVLKLVDIGVLVLFLKFFSKNRKGLPQLSSFYAHVYRSLSKATTTATGATPRNDRFRVDANEHFFSRRVLSVVVVFVAEGFAFGEPRGAVHRSTGGEELFVGRGWRARVTDDA